MRQDRQTPLGLFFNLKCKKGNVQVMLFVHFEVVCDLDMSCEFGVKANATATCSAAQ